jgi:hypothetical protein
MNGKNDDRVPLAPFAALLAAALLVVAILALASPAHALFQRETLHFAWKEALAFGPAPTIHDLLHALDWQAFDGIARVRVLSNLLDAIDAKTVHLLAATGTLSAGARPTAILVLLLLPTLSFLAAKALGRPTETALTAAALAVLSQGGVSGVLLGWHSGKPLAMLAAIALVPLVAAKPTPIKTMAIAIAVIIGGLSDEAFWAAAAGAAVVAFPIARRERSAGTAAIAAITGTAAVAAIVLQLLPWLSQANGMPNYDVVQGFRDLVPVGIDAAVSARTPLDGLRDAALETLVVLWSHWLPFHEIGVFDALNPAAWFPENRRIKGWGGVLPIDPRTLAPGLGTAWLIVGSLILAVLVVAAIAKRRSVAEKKPIVAADADGNPEAKREAIAAGRKLAELRTAIGAKTRKPAETTENASAMDGGLVLRLLLAAAAIAVFQSIVGQGYYLSSYNYAGAASPFVALATAELLSAIPIRPIRIRVLAVALAMAVLATQSLSMNALWIASEYDDQPGWWTDKAKRIAERSDALSEAGRFRAVLVADGARPATTRLILEREELIVRDDWWRWAGHGTHPPLCSVCILVSEPDKIEITDRTGKAETRRILIKTNGEWKDAAP